MWEGKVLILCITALQYVGWGEKQAIEISNCSLISLVSDSLQCFDVSEKFQVVPLSSS